MWEYFLEKERNDEKYQVQELYILGNDSVGGGSMQRSFWILFVPLPECGKGSGKGGIHPYAYHLWGGIGLPYASYLQ